MSERGRHSARSVRKSREAILVTFNNFVLNGKYAEIGVRELARKAGVGRSTFYEHFDDKTALLVESAYPFLSVLADVAAGKEAPTLPWVLAHFEEQGKNALAFFDGAAERKAFETGLARLIEQQLSRTGWSIARDDVASTLSRTTLGLVRDWLAAGKPIRREDLAAVLVRTMSACRSALAG